MSNKETERFLKLIREGDRTVLDVIYRDNRTAFLNFAKKYSLSWNDNLDVYQDAIIALYENIVSRKVHTLDSSIKTYLFSIGKYMIYKKIKENKNTNSLRLEEAEMIESPFEFYEYQDHSESGDLKIISRS